MADGTKRKLTLRQRTLRHRKVHPNDKLSFGETLATKADAQNGIDEANTKQDEVMRSSGSESPLQAPKSMSGALSSGGKVKCRKCGKLALPQTVRIGGCHTSRYGKGYYGQTYSGANGRDRLYGN